MKVVVGSRESKLALIQTRMVIDAIRAWDPEIQVELLTRKTTGTRSWTGLWRRSGARGLFVKELDQALLSGEADLTVHSSKDLPMELDPRLPLVAFSPREDPRDVLVLPRGASRLDPAFPWAVPPPAAGPSWGCCSPGSRWPRCGGTSSPAWKSWTGGEFSALVLAAAGLKRLGLERRISRTFSPEEMLPAAGQGILAVQARQGLDPWFLQGFHSRDSQDCLLAERAFVRALGGGCSAPVGAFAAVEGETLTLRGMGTDGQGRPRYGEIQGPRDQGRPWARPWPAPCETEKGGTGCDCGHCDVGGRRPRGPGASHPPGEGGPLPGGGGGVRPAHRPSLAPVGPARGGAAGRGQRAGPPQSPPGGDRPPLIGKGPGRPAGGALKGGRPLPLRPGRGGALPSPGGGGYRCRWCLGCPRLWRCLPPPASR